MHQHGCAEHDAAIAVLSVCPSVTRWYCVRRSKEKNFIIFSDSMSSLEAISGFKLEIDIVQNIIKDYTNTGKTIILFWILVAMRGLTLQQNKLFLCPLQI